MKLVAPNGAAIEACERAVEGLLAMGFKKANVERKPAPKGAAKRKE